MHSEMYLSMDVSKPFTKYNVFSYCNDCSVWIPIAIYWQLLYTFFKYCNVACTLLYAVLMLILQQSYL